MFLASPGDVGEERELVVRVVRQIDQTVARPLGYSVAVYGWELESPGLGRAQDRINPRVDSCDVLIGLLGSSFGTPTGEYGSGFEEEFERVRDRRERGDEVDAMVYVTERVLPSVDPRNLDFRQRLRDLGLYAEYSSVSDLETQLTGHLAAVVARFAASAVVAMPIGESEGAPAQARGSQRSQGVPALPEAAQALEQVRDALVGDGAELDEAVLLRAHLAVSTEISNRQSASLMHVHDLLRLYGFRSEVSLSSAEETFVLRSMAGLDEVGAGWGLIGASDVEAIGRLLLDSAAEVCHGAITQLGTEGLDAFSRAAGERLDVRPEVVLAHLLEAQEDGLSERAFVDAISQSTHQIDVLLAWIVAHEGPQQVRAFEALVARLCVSDPIAAWDLQRETPSWRPEGLEELLALHAGLIGAERLIAGGIAAELRRVGVTVAIRAGLVGEELTEELLSDSDAEVRRLALAHVFDSEWTVEYEEVTVALERNGKWAADDEAAELRVRFLERGSSEWLLEKARWNQLDFLGVGAIRAAVRRGSAEAVERARRDVADLSASRAEARLDLENSIDEQKLEAALDEVARYAGLYDQIWLTGLLRALNEAGPSAGDAALARPFLTHRAADVSDAALSLLLRVGEDADHGPAFDAVMESYGDDRERRIARLVELRPDADWLLDRSETVESRSGSLSELLHAIGDARLALPRERLDALMRHSEDSVRIAALRIAATGGSRRDLKALLSGYMEAPRYRYYNVINLLDRLIYGPKSVRTTARRALRLGPDPDERD